MASQISTPDWREKCHAQRFKTLQERFDEKVKVDPGGCWIWLGAHDKDGYGFIRIDGKNKKAHRISFELSTGIVLTPHIQVLHSCDNTACVNPKHLRVGSNSDNQIDAVVRGRHHSQKLTVENVVEIRRLCALGLSQAVTAKRFGICESHVYGIAQRLKWRHVA